MEETQSKICKMCFMEIDSRAKKCPYCHHWQNKLTIVVHNPAFMMLLGIIPMVIVFVFVGIMFQRMFDKGEDFAPYRDQITITECELMFGHNNEGPTVIVMGKMKNDTTISWKEVQLELRFYDRDNKMVDTDQTLKFSFVAPANDVSTFKVSIPREFAEEQYVSAEARVLSAKDARTMW